MAPSVFDFYQQKLWKGVYLIILWASFFNNDIYNKGSNRFPHRAVFKPSEHLDSKSVQPSLACTFKLHIRSSNKIISKVRSSLGPRYFRTVPRIHNIIKNEEINYRCFLHAKWLIAIDRQMLLTLSYTQREQDMLGYVRFLDHLLLS